MTGAYLVRRIATFKPRRTMVQNDGSIQLELPPCAACSITVVVFCALKNFIVQMSL